MIRHGSFVHAVVRGPSVYVHTRTVFRIRELHISHLYTHDSYGRQRKKSHVFTAWRKSQSAIYMPRNESSPTEISVKANHLYALRYNLE